MNKSTQTAQLARPQAINTENAAAAPTLEPFHTSKHSTEAIARLLQSLFSRFEGNFSLQLWDGRILNLGHKQVVMKAPLFTLFIHRPKVIRMMLLGRDPLRLAEAYFRGDIDIEGDFFAVLHLRNFLHTIKLPLRERISALLAVFQLKELDLGKEEPMLGRTLQRARLVREHSRSENHQAIQFHYDVSNAFYALWLDSGMVYSCAYFKHAGDSLEVAQTAKLDHICRKLMLKPGDTLLDIGCGWGALLIYAAKHYGVRAHGVTLSQQQLDVARHRIAEAGMEDRVSVELVDYRDLKGESAYDKIVSVGMFEHVGLKNLPLYFATVHRLLKPGGLLLNHGITHDVEGWEKTLSTEFINRYVFPDGQLDTVSNIQRGMERFGFEIGDVESLRAHYALTLRHWVNRLEKHHAQALRYVSESTYRVWRLYMTGCALDFEAGETGIYQILASKRMAGPTQLPLTRGYLYSAN